MAFSSLGACLGEAEFRLSSFRDMTPPTLKFTQVSVVSVARSREYWSWLVPMLTDFYTSLLLDEFEEEQLPWPSKSLPPAVPCRLVHPRFFD